MIGFLRPPEPATLALVRADKLAAARVARAAGTKVDFSEYDIVKEALAAMQHRKCCYCEKREEQAKYRDVEHYRPKSLYWWLAWTWENLLFACIDCNREQKRSRFPLSPGDVPLVAEQAPPGAERPSCSTPRTRRWSPRERSSSGGRRWRAGALGAARVTARGRETVDVCGLARPNLLDLYADHVVHVVRPKLEGFFAAREGDPQTAFQAWERAKRGLLARERPFRALSHDALNVLVPAEIRDRDRLTLDRPAP